MATVDSYAPEPADGRLSSLSRHSCMSSHAADVAAVMGAVGELSSPVAESLNNSSSSDASGEACSLQSPPSASLARTSSELNIPTFFDMGQIKPIINEVPKNETHKAKVTVFDNMIQANKKRKVEFEKVVPPSLASCCMSKASSSMNIAHNIVTNKRGHLNLHALLSLLLYYVRLDEKVFKKSPSVPDLFVGSYYCAGTDPSVCFPSLEVLNVPLKEKVAKQKKPTEEAEVVDQEDDTPKVADQEAEVQVPMVNTAGGDEAGEAKASEEAEIQVEGPEAAYRQPRVTEERSKLLQKRPSRWQHRVVQTALNIFGVEPKKPRLQRKGAIYRKSHPKLMRKPVDDA